VPIRKHLSPYFENLFRIFWLVDSRLVLIAIAAARFRRSDVLTALSIGRS
jgi:hypothetical protein